MQLHAPWRVFYSRPWLGLESDGRDREGEADFVLIHPRHGMLVLEVKGGGIERAAPSGEWYSTNSDGDRVRIKNPAMQASRNKYGLLEWLRKQKTWDDRFICARHAVVFPDCLAPRGDLGPDLPRQILCDLDQMPLLGRWVEELMTTPADSRVVALGHDGVDLLTGYFSKGFTLPRPIAASLQCDEEEIRILTDQQIAILGAISHQRRMAIPGLAGTGKTALAVAKALKLAREAKRTALLCYNRPLASQLNMEIGKVPNLVVNTYHGLCVSLARRAPGALAAEPVGNPDFYRRDLPAALKKALSSNPEEKFDAVIIDEGQDFEDGWYDGVEALLRNPAEGVLYVFFDDNQRVHFNTSTITAHFPSSPIRLTRIVRNARQIVEALAPLLPSPYEADGPEGRLLEFIESKGDLGETDIAARIKSLVKDHHVRPEQIAVLVPDEKWRKRLVRGERIGDWPVRDAEAPPGTIVCETFRRFKGLERGVVIVCEPEAAIGEPALLYVTLTRARFSLILLASKGRLNQVRTLLAKSSNAPSER